MTPLRYKKSSQEDGKFGTSLAVQWLRLCASNAGDTGSNPGQGTKTLHDAMVWPKKKR